MSKKYYAVVRGFTPGIYTDWPTTQRMTQGYSGAIFKSFKTLTEAEEFLKNSTLQKPQINYDKPLTNRSLIYTDGSYHQGKAGFGVVVLNKDDKIQLYGRVPQGEFSNPPTNNVAELYAIYVALSAVEGDIDLFTDSNYALSGLTTYINDWIKINWVGVSNVILFKRCHQLMMGRDVNLQYVAAHKGHDLNEEVDQLALLGREQLEPLIIIKNKQRII